MKIESCNRISSRTSARTGKQCLKTILCCNLSHVNRCKPQKSELVLFCLGWCKIIPPAIRRQHGSISFWTESSSFSLLALYLFTVLSRRLALCSQVFYHGKHILSVLTSQGDKKLAPVGDKGSSNFLIDVSKVFTQYFYLSHVVDPRLTWEIMLCLGAPNLSLW